MKTYKVHRRISLSLILIMLFQIISPTISYALTSGPSQPEVQSFEPVGTSQMVDLFSGDFNYNIPLLEVGGYPINIAYHAGIGMEQEASWVGLGWNLNPGAINRNMRGIPDDFSGETINKEVNVKDNVSVSFIAQPKAEALGLPPNLNLAMGIRNNSYKGLSILGSANIGIDVINMGAFGLNAKLGIDLENGISIAPSLSTAFSIGKKKNVFKGGLNIGAPYNSRQGLQDISYSLNYSRKSFNASGKSMYKASFGASANHSLSTFNTPSYITHSDFNSDAFSFSLNLALGGEVPFLNIAGSILGSYSRHTTQGSRSLRSYGYMNHHLANPAIDLLDFNREHDGPYFESSGVLPLTNLTNDVFGITGQGMGGVFRGFHNRITFVTDPFTFTTSGGGSVGGDIGIIASPFTFKGGGNLSMHALTSTSGLWFQENGAIAKYNNRSNLDPGVDEMLFEPSYLKQLGELSSDKGRFDNLGRETPLAFDIDNHELDTDLNHSGGAVTVNEIEEERAIRNQLTVAKTFKDVLDERYNRVIRNYIPGLGENGNLNFSSHAVKDYQELLEVPESQIFEYDVLRPDGMRYVYGQPAYNLLKEETILNAPSNSTYHESEGLKEYDSDDLLPNNGNGIDDFVSREVVPAYTYSHLLTEVLSADYSDLTGNGPTNDDYGSWVKFNYSCTAGPLNPDHSSYNWRFPYGKEGSNSYGTGNFNEGLKSKTLDDKINYTYGEKELWFLHSLESRTHIAIFHTSDRDDAKGVENNFGRTSGLQNIGSQNQQLDSIQYFAKHDLAQYGANAIPIKTAHLGYDYSLCKGVPNNFNSDTNNNGKLTLRTLHFTYGNSQKGTFSKYNFDYSDVNPNYNKKAQDRWGCYKEEPALSDSDYLPQNIATAAALSNTDFPYAEQNLTDADEYAQAWNLTKIGLPSGGTIDVNYESDDYAYVQDKHAGQMFKLEGFSKGVPDEIADAKEELIVSSGGLVDYEFRNHMVVKLVDDTDTREAFFRKYLRDMLFGSPEEDLKLYFRALVNIKDGKHEFVPGYADILDYGVFQDPVDAQYYGWIELKGVDYDDNDSNGLVNPIAKGAWQFARLQMPELVYPGSDFDDNAFERFIKSVAGIFTKEIPRMIKGFNKSLRDERYARFFVPEKSWVRLNNPNYHKKGGGCRVSKVIMSDEWSLIKDGSGTTDNASYGQQYFYEKLTTDDNGDQLTISSGVASYEPMLGNDENPFKQPIYNNEARLLAPDNENYIEKPLGESFFPGATIGYSQVIVADIRPDESAKRTATGYAVNEFYTSKDFPYQIKVNQGDFKKDEPGVLSQIFKFRSHDLVTATKGYSVILNDMHGKPKANWVYGGALPVTNDQLELTEDILMSRNKISGQEYMYRMNESNELDNEVRVIKSDGTTDMATIGIESEAALDFREHFSQTIQSEFEGNIDTWVIPIPFFPPLIIPTLWNNFSDETTRFRSAVVTKLVNQHGLVDKVRAYDQGAIIETQNQLYDEQTGEVLLTSVNNEFKDKIDEIDPIQSEENILYNMKYPAHWAYTGMQQAYQNIGVEVEDIELTANGDLSVDNAGALFQPGDELAASMELNFTLSTVRGEIKLWVSSVDKDNNTIRLIDRNGSLIADGYLFAGLFSVESNGTVDIKVIRSGFRNQQAIPIASMASLRNPVEQIFDDVNLGGSDLTLQADNLEVLDFNAQQFGEKWESFCGTNALDTQYIEVTREFCSDCADVLFVIDESGSVTDVEFQSMREHVIETMQDLDDQQDGDYRYGIVFFDTDAEIIIPFTASVEEASNFFRDSKEGTDLNFSLDNIKDFIDNSDLSPREDCPLNIAVFTDGGEVDISGDYPNASIPAYAGSNQLKQAPYHATMEVVRYGGGTAANAAGAATASPGWDYDGTVADNGYDWETVPRRFIATTFGEPLPSVVTDFNCFDTTFLEPVVSPILCGVQDGDVINPYVNGILGNWRPTTSYVHRHVPRVQTPINDPAPGVDIANKGYYQEFDQFWNRPTIDEPLWTPDISNYIAMAEVTRYNPYGEALENRDALGIYSSVLLGYDKKLAIAVGSNTQYQEIAFDGFEEYDYYVDPNVCHANYHLDLDAVDYVTMDEAHTGYYSFKVNSGNVETRSVELNCHNSSSSNNDTTTPYQIDKCEDCLPTFNPIYRTENDAENRYVFDAWVKRDTTSNFILIEVKPEDDLSTLYLFQPKGPVIDGWQRIYEFFELAPNMELINISFNNIGSNSPMYVDDIRMYPFDANMKSFVYHPSSLKLIAELDANNHATFYEYDQEWNLIRVKKETERGIMTLQENRSHVRLDRTQ